MRLSIDSSIFTHTHRATTPCIHGHLIYLEYLFHSIILTDSLFVIIHVCRHMYVLYLYYCVVLGSWWNTATTSEIERMISENITFWTKMYSTEIGVSKWHYKQWPKILTIYYIKMCGDQHNLHRASSTSHSWFYFIIWNTHNLVGSFTWWKIMFLAQQLGITWRRNSSTIL